MPLCEFIRNLEALDTITAERLQLGVQAREAINRKSFAAQALPSQSQKSSLQGTF